MRFSDRRDKKDLSNRIRITNPMTLSVLAAVSASLEKPNSFTVLSVDDNGTLELQLLLTEV